MKLEPFKVLFAEFSETPHGATLFRPSILKISWISETTVSFYAYCNLGTYLITVDTKEPNKNPISHKLSDEFLEPTKEGEQAGAGQPATRPESKSEGSDKPQPEAEGRSR